MKRFLFFSLSVGSLLTALPTDHTVVHGEVDVSQVGSSMHIQASDRAIIDWKDFSISQGELAKFIQPSIDAAVLNRVEGNKVSHILGQLQSNGHVFLVNPQGVIIGKDAIIDVGGFTASTLDLLNDDFLKNNLHFKGLSEAPVINLGTIHAWNGDVTLLGFKVEQAGDIKAPNGAVSLVEGRDILLSPESNQRIFVRISKEEKREGVGISNTGTIEAIEAHLVADGNLYSYAINQEGKITATGIEERDGRLFLVAKEGTIENKGTLIAQNGDGTGGTVHVLGKSCGVTGNARIDASGNFGGGTVLVGGDYQGKNSDIENAMYTYVGEDVLISVNAFEKGDGGRVILWSDARTEFYGNIEGKGGFKLGNGGFTEVSGAQLVYRGLANLAATNGEPGQLYLDPTDITLANGMGTTGSFLPPNVYGTSDYDVVVGTNPNYIEVTTLEAQLNIPVNVTIDTSSGSLGTGIFTFQDPITNWTGNSTLSIRASQIDVNASIIGTGATPVVGLTADNQLNVNADISSYLVNLFGSDIKVNSGVTVTATFSFLAQPVNQMVIDNATLSGGANGLSIYSSNPQTPEDLKILNGSTLNSSNLIRLGSFDYYGPLQNPIGGLGNLTIESSTLQSPSIELSVQGFTQISNASITADSAINAVSASGININASTINVTLPTGTTRMLFQSLGSVSISGNTVMNATSPDSVVLVTGPLVFAWPVWRSFPVRSADSISLTNSSVSGGDLIVEGNQVSFSNVALSGSRAFVRSKNTTSMMAGSILTTTGPVIIDVDSRFRNPLQIGTGSFQMDASSLINTNGGRLEIWTARRQFNTINGFLNGQKFTPGPLYTNNTFEHWGTFFPEHPLTGQPYSIYYNDSGQYIQTALTAAGVNPFILMVPEMLTFLHEYDEFLVLAERFETLYDREGSVGVFSSFGSGEDRRFFIRRPTFYDNRVPLIPQPRKFFQTPPEDEQVESRF